MSHLAAAFGRAAVRSRVAGTGVQARVFGLEVFEHHVVRRAKVVHGRPIDGRAWQLDLRAGTERFDRNAVFAAPLPSLLLVHAVIAGSVVWLWRAHARAGSSAVRT